MYFNRPQLITATFNLVSVIAVKKLNFRHMSHIHFPSAASKATKDWMNYSDRVDVPTLDLMENMDRDGATVVFMAFKDLASIVSLRYSDQIFRADPEKEGFFLNSKVAMASIQNLGYKGYQPLIPEPILATFEHLHPENRSEDPICVHWDESAHDWSHKACKLVFTNSTHSECACQHFGLLGLYERVHNTESGGASFDADSATLIIIVVVVVLAVLAFALVVLFNHFKLQAGGKMPSCLRFREEEVTPTRHALYPSPQYHHDPYSEIMPHHHHSTTIAHHPRPQPGPQSAANTIRRKSTAFDHFPLAEHDNNHASAAVNQIFDQFKRTNAPLSTPERPLLDSPMRRSSIVDEEQHIYVEVGSDLDNTTAGGDHRHHFQPIHIPIVRGITESNRSSGYFSGINNSEPSQQQQLKSPEKRLRMDMQDSQFI